VFGLWSEVAIMTTWGKEGKGKDCDTLISSSKRGGGLTKG